MYGLVNRAIEDLVIATAGEDTWLKVKEHAGLKDLQLLDTKNYSDDVTFELVKSASEILDMSVVDILYTFGKHWILYTGREGWSALFAASGDDFISFLEILDDMHARVNAAMPEGRMPEFTLTAKDGHYQLEYRSERSGLAPMVSGILDGLAEQFDEPWDIEHVGGADQSGTDLFMLTRKDLPVSEDWHDAA